MRLVSLLLGVVLGLMVASLIVGGPVWGGAWHATSLGPGFSATSFPAPNGPAVVEIAAITLIVPTVAPTPTPTVRSTPSPVRTPADFCTMTPEPGKACRWPEPTPLPPTPYPSCEDARAGDWCRWPTTPDEPAASGEQEVG